MTKHKKREEDIIEQKDAEKEAAEEVAEIEHGEADFELAEKLKEAEIKSEEFAGAKDLADKYLNNWKRAVADFENYKKRQAESGREFAKFASMNMILQILPVLDNFQSATAHIPENQKSGAWAVGIMHIQKQLEKVLEDNGVSEIAAKEGDGFDPELHEAVTDTNQRMQSESADKISKIILKGYKIDGKVIRPTRVVVG